MKDWNLIDSSQIHDRMTIEEWKKIKQNYPPSFFTVWVKLGNKKKKAYFDAPNQEWICDSVNWDGQELKGVEGWREIPNNTIKSQANEWKSKIKDNPCSRKAL